MLQYVHLNSTKTLTTARLHAVNQICLNGNWSNTCTGAVCVCVVVYSKACLKVNMHARTFNVKYRSVFNVQQRWPQGKHALCFFFFFSFFCCLVVFVCSYLPHSLLCPPPHAAWGMIKSVYACPQSMEIGVNTHPYSHLNGQTYTQYRLI